MLWIAATWLIMPVLAVGWLLLPLAGLIELRSRSTPRRPSPARASTVVLASAALIIIDVWLGSQLPASLTWKPTAFAGLGLHALGVMVWVSTTLSRHLAIPEDRSEVPAFRTRVPPAPDSGSWTGDTLRVVLILMIVPAVVLAIAIAAAP